MKGEISEDQFQAELFEWFWNTFPEAHRAMWAVPNGGWRHAGQLKLLEATGVVAGVWDLHLFWRGQFYIFELKVGSNTLSKPQQRWGALMLEHGAETYEIHERFGGREIFKKVCTDIVRGSGKLGAAGSGANTNSAY